MAAIRSVLASTGVPASEVAAIGLTGQMHGLVLLDAADRVLRPAILWNDQRTAHACDEIRETVGAERLIRDHRQRRADRVHGPEARLGPRPRAGRLEPGRPCPAAEGLRPAAPHRRARDRRRRRRRHDPVRPGGPDVVDARSSRRSGSIRRGCRRCSRAPRSPARLTAAAAEATGLRAGTPVDRRRRRPVGERRRARRRRRGNARAVARDVRRRVRPDPHRRSSSRAAASTPSATPCPGRWHLMSVMLSAAGQPALVPRHARAGRAVRSAHRRGRRRAGRQRRAALPPLPHR